MNDRLVKMRMELLIAELEHAGFEGFEHSMQNSQFLEEIQYACRPEIHEGKSPTYGAIIMLEKVERMLSSEPTSIIDADLPESRKLADGQFSFVVRHTGGSHLLVTKHSFGSEYDAFRIRDEYLMGQNIYSLPQFDMGIVQRCENGAVRAFGPKSIAVRQNEVWSVKPYKYSYAEGIQLSAELTGEARYTMRHLILLCVHSLSARGIGALIVFKRTQGVCEGVEPMPGYWTDDVGLRFDHLQSHSAAAQLLSQIDGALLLHDTGKVEALGGRLCTDGPLKPIPHEKGGTKHNSAKIYSANHKDCIVIVVSESGPVTVFMCGAVAAHRDPVLGRPRILTNCQCNLCKVDFALEESSSEREVRCQVCGSDIDDSLPKLGYLRVQQKILA